MYLDALGHESETGLVAILDDFRGEQLLAQRCRYLTDMERGGNPPAQLEHPITSTVQTDATHAEVGAKVYPIWWDKDGGGTSLHGSSHPWRFTTHDDDGSQIEQVDPYPWCDGFVRAETCG